MQDVVPPGAMWSNPTLWRKILLDIFLWGPSIIQTQLRMDCPCVGLGSRDLTAEGLQCALWIRQSGLH